MDGAKPVRHERQTKHIDGSGSAEHAVLGSLHAAVLASEESASIYTVAIDDLPDPAGIPEDDVSRRHRGVGDIGSVEKVPGTRPIATLLDAQVLCRPIGHIGDC